MSDIFSKNQQESQAAYNEESQIAFQRFAEKNNIKSEIDVEAYLITKQVFTAGFVCGAQLILSKLVEQMKAKEANDKSK
jgi:hypothetical protein